MTNIGPKSNSRSRNSSSRKITVEKLKKFKNSRTSWAKDSKNSEANNRNVRSCSELRWMSKDSTKLPKPWEIKFWHKINNWIELNLNLSMSKLLSKNSWKNLFLRGKRIRPGSINFCQRNWRKTNNGKSVRQKNEISSSKTCRK